MQRFFNHLPRRSFLLTMLAGSALITASSLVYFDFDAVPGFVIEKLPMRFESAYLAALRVHVAAASLSLPLCLVLMTRWLQRRIAWHKWFGRVAGVLVLFALVPSGAILSAHAKGGAISTAGFLLSGGIIAWFMARGVAAARRHEVAAHRRAMRHVLAQMSVAVTSRALLIAFDMAGFEPDSVYVIALWGPVLASAGVAELISLKSGSVSGFASTLWERTRRETSRLALRVRSRFVTRPVGLGR